MNSGYEKLGELLKGNGGRNSGVVGDNRGCKWAIIQNIQHRGP